MEVHTPLALEVTPISMLTWDLTQVLNYLLRVTIFFSWVMFKFTTCHTIVGSAWPSPDGVTTLELRNDPTMTIPQLPLFRTHRTLHDS